MREGPGGCSTTGQFSLVSFNLVAVYIPCTATKIILICLEALFCRFTIKNKDLQREQLAD